VEFDLGGNFVRQNAIVEGYGDRGFVAGGVDGEDFHNHENIEILRYWILGVLRVGEI
jgi:hypothetical protein